MGSDVIVAGDGPAAALAVRACRAHGLDVIAVGPGATWSNTYAVWRDEAADLPDTCFSTVVPNAVVRVHTERRLARAYGVLDNQALREHLGLDDVLRRGRVDRQVDTGSRAVAHLDDGEVLTANWLIDATGHRGESPAWQTGYGVVVAENAVERVGLPTDAATIMAWLPGDDPTCFVYAIPISDGWLVEVTSLAARRAVDPQRLRRRLIELVGEATVVAAEALGRTETVRIPMGGQAPPVPGRRVVPFGTAGGGAHPSTGYSLASGLAMAPVVARAIADGRDPVDAAWSPSLRRNRMLHDAGLDVLLDLTPGQTHDFFEAFFSVPVERWSDYLRVDAPSDRTAAAMRSVFRAAPWSVRRRLGRIDRRLLGSLLLPGAR